MLERQSDEGLSGLFYIHIQNIPELGFLLIAVQRSPGHQPRPPLLLNKFLVGALSCWRTCLRPSQSRRKDSLGRFLNSFFTQMFPGLQTVFLDNLHHSLAGEFDMTTKNVRVLISYSRGVCIYIYTIYEKYI